MGFVNEYVPDEDIEKYDLHGIWDKYHPLYKGELFFGNKPEWTVDREANVFLMSIAIGRGEHGNRTKFLLWLDGTHIIAEIDLVDGSSGDLNANPFIVVWDLARVDVPPELEADSPEIMGMLKNALSTYGYWGIRNQRPNTVVKFKF
jgi:hypothetical protein